MTRQTDESAYSNEQKSYEIDDLWRHEHITDIDKKRIESLAGIIPEDVKSVLDVGCGNGIFINYLHI